MRKIIVIGAGGHARSVCDILMQDSENEIVGLLDGPEANGFWGYKIIGNDDLLPHLLQDKLAEYAFVAIGNNALRKKLTVKVKHLGFHLVNAVSPAAYISPRALLGTGIAIMPGAVIGPNACVGDGSIINTNASIDHDDTIGTFCHIAPGSTLCGTVSVGDEVFVGAGARIIDGLSIGDGSIIGAGAAVIRDIPSYCTAVGVPARIIKYHSHI